mmetsp:Transcript_25933/g.46080  ORF Transcript_25933/g.46080 Transcript_25933/m.46080 type:complete len:142 (+) Transcript_25933:63-488(+)|eukprot:CAMPEP_0197521202 /NCGR_PEP_ID=MMETSP1318-20131121/6482_1 /TAXON_ID=552666 /ORGANISM="Partenskyella glossopodia, Strain RCC365" /LENGTH=141 /DNA_ID=CAMNT_0043073077 /DNA_START=64 /DNA_END=489 /DNA_ORIENTATION=-
MPLTSRTFYVALLVAIAAVGLSTAAETKAESRHFRSRTNATATSKIEYSTIQAERELEALSRVFMPSKYTDEDLGSDLGDMPEEFYVDNSKKEFSDQDMEAAMRELDHMEQHSNIHINDDDENTIDGMDEQQFLSNLLSSN